MTPDDLLRGMWYALESCGEGLQAAADLIEHGHYGRSAAVAMAARDEFGKARLLRDLWRRADAGSTVTFDEVRAICGERVKGVPPVTHIKKQQAAQASVTLRAGPGDPLKTVMDRLVRARGEVDALSKQGTPIEDPRLRTAYAERDTVEAEFQKFVEAEKLSVPSDRTKLRERGQYVDVMVEAGKVCWKRPNEITYDETMVALMHASNDYRLMSITVQPPFNAKIGVVASPRFAAALAAWTDKPALPEAPDVRYLIAAEAAAPKTSPGGS